MRCDLRVAFAKACENISDAVGLAVGERLSGSVHEEMLELDANISKVPLAACSKKTSFDVAFAGRLMLREAVFIGFALKGEQIGIVHVFLLATCLSVW